MRHKARQHSEALVFSDDKSYSCQQCGKQFGKISKLTQHMKTHRFVSRCRGLRLTECVIAAPRTTTNIPVISAARSSPDLST